MIKFSVSDSSYLIIKFQVRKKSVLYAYKEAKMKFVKLLRPASAVMDRLRISHKFGLIFFIVLVPMLILSFVIVQEKNSRI